MVDGILSTILMILILNNRNLDFNSSSVISIVNRKSVNRKSQGYSIFKDGDLAIVIGFVAGLLAAGDGEHLVDELRHELLHGTALNELTG